MPGSDAGPLAEVDAGVANVDAGVDAGPADGGALPDAGSAEVDAGLYVPAVYSVQPPVTFQVSYPNVVAGYPGVTATERTIGIAVYRPVGAPLPAPIVILAHGGGEGLANPLTAMEDWAPVVARAGYVVVAIAFHPRTPAELTAICQRVGNVDTVCGVGLSWDRPSDVSAVIDFLTAKTNDPALAGLLDLSQIATLSHSAGSGAMQFVGGMTTSYKCMRPFGAGQHDCRPADLVSRRDVRVKAIALMSPQGPGGFGFIEPTSFLALQVPMFIATGSRDDTGQAGEALNRKKVFGLVPPGERFLLWLESPGTRHSFFNHQLDECATETTSARCLEMQTWLEASTIAFLDDQLRGSLAARAYLKSNALSQISEGAAQPEFR